MRFASRSACLSLVLLIAAVTTAVADELAINVLSNRADLISGDDALVEVVVPANVATADVHVALNGVDVTSSFGLTVSGRFLGLVTGLDLGDNDIEASVTAPTLHPSVVITVTNHPIGGPVFAGAQLQPWVCARKVATSVLVTVPNTALSANVTTRVSGLNDDPVDAQCNTPPTLAFFYQPKALEGSNCNFTNQGANACFIAYDVNNPPAEADVANFTNDRGDTVKSIILLEKGTINRTIYQLVTFYDPTKPNTPQAPQTGWNRKLLWNFGASSGTSRFESPPGTGVFNTTALSRGFMIASASLTDHGTNANDQLGAETVAMLKEQITETYGEIRYTMGAGCSGGSIMQYNIAAAYPGLLQGIQPNCTFPDTLTTAIEVAECGMLQGNYFTAAPGNTLTTAQRGAILGHNTTNYCTAWNAAFLPSGNPATPANCGSGWPAALTYNAVSRPQGVRCEVFDHDVAMLGTFVDTDGNTKANQPFDNVGVQYGLKALQNGTITAEQFVQLNEGAGSYTADQIFRKPQRAVASLGTLHTVYSGSLVSDGRQLAKTAIIDLRGNNTALDIHLNWRSWSVRDRLDKANGHHGNMVIWATGAQANTPGAAMLLRSFNTMDAWLANIEADQSNVPLEQKIVNDKPPLAVDLCTAGNGATEASIVDVGLGTPACPVQYTLSPRQAAGGPLSEDVFKCQLKTLDFASPDYNGIAFSVAQQGRLAAVFPNGVCDWTLAGVGQVPADGWTTFANGPGGQPLGAVPTSDTVPPVCSDGIVRGESCDDGDTDAGDGCSATCVVEAGWTCDGSPSTCSSICGDGLVVGGEACDDGNPNAADGCSSSCAVETGWTCGGAPSACTAICGDGLVLGAEGCDEGGANGSAAGCCGAACQPKASGASCDDGNACTTSDTCNGANACVGGAAPNCDDANSCTVDACVPATGCTHDGPARDGFACDDGNGCSSGDVCAGGVCGGTIGDDTDGDGYCDASEAASGCNANDAREIPPQSAVFGGAPSNGAGNILITFLAPTTKTIAKATDPSCATVGVCGGNGFCTAGKIADPCAADADCNQVAGTCRVVVNYAAVPLTLRKPVTLGKTELTSFEPLTPGCSRKVDIVLDPAAQSTTLKLNVSGTVSGKARRDTDNFRYR